MANKPITPEDAGLAATMYLDGMCLEQIGREIGFSRGGIKKWLVKMGIEIDSKRRDTTHAGCFKPGFTPWNAGKQGAQTAWNKGLTKEDHPSIAKTGFQPGRAPRNTGRTHFKFGKGFWTGKHRPNMTGEKHPMYKGGKNYEATSIRHSIEYRDWRTAVFERDNYTCQNCSIKGGYLQADHIKPFCLYEDLRFDIDNGRTLCKQCHYAIGWNYFREMNPNKQLLTN